MSTASIQVHQLVDRLARHPYAVLIAAGLILSLPLLKSGLPFNSWDTVWHSLYYENFAPQFWSGELYPRWLYLLNGGFGGPTFFYYPPLTYYAASVFYLLPISTLHQLGLATSLALIASGITAFLWLREISSVRPALLTAVVYLLLPYHTNWDIYGRAALAEVFAFIWMPLILFFVARMAKGHRAAVVGLALSYAALCTTHLLTTLIFSPLPVLYAWWMAQTGGRVRSLLSTLGAMFVGLGLSAVYVLPSMVYQDYVYFQEFVTVGNDFKKGLLTSALTVEGSMKTFWMVLETAIAGVVCFVGGHLSAERKYRRELILWIAIALGGVFMMTSLSQPLWESIQALQMLQFPSRFNTVLCIAVLPLIARGFGLFRPRYRWPGYGAAAVVILLSISWAIDLTTAIGEAYAPPISWRSEFSERIGRLKLDTHPLWPRSAPHTAFYGIETALKTYPHTGDEIAKAYIPNSAGSVSVDTWRPRRIGLHVAAASDVTITVSQFAYPGWRARTAEGNELPVTSTADLGLINIKVPQGDHHITLTLERLWPEFVGWGISGLSALLVVLFPFILRRLPETTYRRTEAVSLDDEIHHQAGSGGVLKENSTLASESVQDSTDEVTEERIDEINAGSAADASSPPTSVGIPDRSPRPSTFRLLYPYVFLLLLGVIVSSPLLLHGITVMSDDTPYARLYYEHFARQLWAGDLHPRWLSGINGGLGGPTFFYYPPLAFYLASVLYPLPLNTDHQLGLAQAAVWMASGIAAYLWLKEIGKKNAALFASAIYLILPYHVYDVFGRGALSEQLAFLWMPLILLSVRRLGRGSLNAMLGLGLSYAALCLTHLLTTLIFSPLPLVYGVLVSERNARRSTLGRTVLGMVIGAGLAATYIVPAMLYQDYIYIEEFTSVGFEFYRGLITWDLSLYGSMRYFWMIVEVAGAALLCFVTALFGKTKGRKTEMVFWIAVIAVSVVMMLYVSFPVWDYVKPLQMLQFPWRFNIVISIAAVALVAIALSSISRARLWIAVPMLLVLAYCGVSWMRQAQHAADTAFAPPIPHRSEFSARVAKLKLDTHALWPRSVPIRFYYGADELLYGLSGDDNDSKKAHVANGSGVVNVRSWRPGDISLDVDTATNAEVNVAQFFFPGWRANLYDEVTELQVTAQKDTGVVNIAVPSGQHKIDLRLGALWPELLGDVITAVSAGICLVLFLWFARKKTAVTTLQA